VKLAAGSTLGSTLNGFGTGDKIDLSAIAYKSSFEAYFYAGASGGTLQIVDTADANAVVVKVKFSGPDVAQAYALGTDGAAGFDIAVSSTQSNWPGFAA
jgi:hypothetical protein